MTFCDAILSVSSRTKTAFYFCHARQLRLILKCSFRLNLTDRKKVVIDVWDVFAYELLGPQWHVNISMSRIRRQRGVFYLEVIGFTRFVWETMKQESDNNKDKRLEPSNGCKDFESRYIRILLWKNSVINLMSEI